MQLRRHLTTALRWAGGAYPLLIFAVCRNGVSTDGSWALALLYFAVGVPVVFVSFSAARALAGGRANVKWLIFVSLLLVLCALVWWFAPQLQPHYQWFFLAQDLAFFVLLAYYFGSSLVGGREPLCTFFARLVHPLSPELFRYTRALTRAWALFFVIVSCTSTALFFSSSSSTWAFFTNVLTPALVAAFFVVENVCRRFLLPPGDRIGLLGTFNAIRMGGYRGAEGRSTAKPGTVG
jgi:uncharacterized membrane protein